MSTLSQQNPNTASEVTGGEAAPAPPNGAALAKGALCPYCGGVSADMTRCTQCKGKFEPLSRQATQNAMGPWQIKDPKHPFLPGCSYERLRRAVEQGRVTRSTVVRGPTTRQFWSFACNAPGVAVLLGECHSCHEAVKTDAYMCGKCGVLLSPATDRQSLGLSPLSLIPGEAPPDVVASTSLGAVTRPDTPTPLKVGTIKPAIEQKPMAAAQHQAQASAVRERLGEMERRNELEVRRLRGKVVGARVFAGAFVISTIALAGTLVYFVMNPVERTVAVPVEQPRAAVEPEPAQAQESASAVEAEVSEAGFDARLGPWQAEIDRLVAAGESDDLDAVESALAELRSIRDEAQAAHEGVAFPALDERIREVKARVDNMRLRELLEED